MKMLSARLPRTAAGTLVAFVVVLFPATDAQSHGTQSEVQVLGRNLDGYDLTVRTEPKRPRTGRLHIEVQLIDSSSLTYIEQATVTAMARLRGMETLQAGPVRSEYRAPWHEMELHLQKIGTWQIHLLIDGPRGQRETTLHVDVLAE
jgi:hypothetical protein